MADSGLKMKAPMHARYKIEKYLSDADYMAGNPDSISEFQDNLFLQEGMTELWNLVCDLGSPTAYSTGAARLGVGDSTNAAVATQTGLQAGSNYTFVAMDAGYPQLVGTPSTAQFKSTFGSAVANFGWQEFTVDNGSGPDKNLNRKVSNQSTKAGGQTWVLTVELSVVNP